MYSAPRSSAAASSTAMRVGTAGLSRPRGRARRRRPPARRPRARSGGSGVESRLRRPVLRGWRADPGEQPERDDQHRESGDEPDRDAAEQRAHQGGQAREQTRSTTIVGTTPRRGGESRVSGASVRSDRRAMCTYGRRPYAMFPVAGVAFLRRGRGLRCACAAGRGTAAGPRWRPPCRVRPRRCTRPRPGCRASRAPCPGSRSRPSS